MTSLPGIKKNNMATKYILLVFKTLLYYSTNVEHYFIWANKQLKLKKDVKKVSGVGLLFDFNLQYRSIYAAIKLLAQFSFGSALKME